MRALPGALLLVVSLPASAQDRELSTDRPDKTESAYSVPAGRVQVEMDLANYTRDRDGDVRTETVGVAPFNLKLGLDRSTDLQLVVAPYIRRRETDLAPRTGTTVEGIGDVTIRLKRNLWGNDGGRTAFALMPYITLPTSRDGLGTDKVEFGLIAPLAVALSEGVDLGLMTEIDVVATETGDGRRVNVVNSATVGFSLTDRLGLYTELFTERSDRWVVTGDAGLTYAIGKDTQLDAGVNLGLTDTADDVGLFVGLSRRF